MKSISLWVQQLPSFCSLKYFRGCTAESLDAFVVDFQRKHLHFALESFQIWQFLYIKVPISSVCLLIIYLEFELVLEDVFFS